MQMSGRERAAVPRAEGGELALALARELPPARGIFRRPLGKAQVRLPE